MSRTLWEEVRGPSILAVSPDGEKGVRKTLWPLSAQSRIGGAWSGRYLFTAIPCTSKRASKSNVPAPRKARAGNSRVKYVLYTWLNAS